MTALRSSNSLASLRSGSPGIMSSSGSVPRLPPNGQIPGYLPSTSGTGISGKSLTGGMALFREPPSWPNFSLDLDIVEPEAEHVDSTVTLPPRDPYNQFTMQPTHGDLVRDHGSPVRHYTPARQYSPGRPRPPFYSSPMPMNSASMNAAEPIKAEQNRDNLDASFAARFDYLEKMVKDALELSKNEKVKNENGAGPSSRDYGQKDTRDLSQSDLGSQRDLGLNEQLAVRKRMDMLEAALKEDLAQERQAREELAEKLSLELRARQGQRNSVKEMLDVDRKDQEDRMAGHVRQLDALTNRVREMERNSREQAAVLERMANIEMATKEAGDKLSGFSGVHEAQKLRLQSIQDRLGAVEVKVESNAPRSSGQLEDSVRNSQATLQILSTRLGEVEGKCSVFVAVQREVFELKQRLAEHPGATTALAKQLEEQLAGHMDATDKAVQREVEALKTQVQGSLAHKDATDKALQHEMEFLKTQVQGAMAKAASEQAALGALDKDQLASLPIRLESHAGAISELREAIFEEQRKRSEAMASLPGHVQAVTAQLKEDVRADAAAHKAANTEMREALAAEQRQRQEHAAAVREGLEAARRDLDSHRSDMMDCHDRYTGSLTSFAGRLDRLEQVPHASARDVQLQQQQQQQQQQQHGQLEAQLSGVQKKLEELEQALRSTHANTVHVTELVAKERNTRELQANQYSEAVKKEVEKRESSIIIVSHRVERLEHDLKRASALLSMDCISKAELQKSHGEHMSQQTQLADRVNIVENSISECHKAIREHQALSQDGEDERHKALMSRMMKVSGLIDNHRQELNGFRQEFQGLREAHGAYASKHDAMEGRVTNVEDSLKELQDLQPHLKDEAILMRQNSPGSSTKSLTPASSPGSAIMSHRNLGAPLPVMPEPQDTRPTSFRLASPANLSALDERRRQPAIPEWAIPDSSSEAGSATGDSMRLGRSSSSPWLPAPPQNTSWGPGAPCKQERPPVMCGTTPQAVDSASTAATSAASAPSPQSMAAFAANLKTVPSSGTFSGSTPVGRPVARSSSPPSGLLTVAEGPVLRQENPPVVMSSSAPVNVRRSSPA